VGTIVIDTPLNQTGYAVDVEKETNETSVLVTTRYVDARDATTQLELTLFETGNETNVVDSYSSASPGNESVKLLAGAEPRDLTLLVEATREIDGETQQVRLRYPIRGADGGLGLGFPKWTGTASLVAIIFVAAMSSRRLSAPMMLVTVAFAGMLMFWELVNIWVPGWWIASAIALLAVYQEQGGY
jgi:hypothetical protein